MSSNLSPDRMLSVPFEADLAKQLGVRELVEAALQASENPRAVARRFLDDDSTGKYGVGRNEDILALHKVRPLDGLVDDYFTAEHWHGIPIVKSHQLPVGSVVINGSTSIAPVAVEQLLSGMPNIHAVGLHEVVASSQGVLNWPSFVRQQREEIAEHFDAWLSLYEEMADEISRQTLLDTLRFRLTADPRYMRDYQVRIDEQYFEPFMNYSREVFVDAGGYDGDTTEAFARRYPDYRKVIFFEPSQQNMAAAHQRLAGIRDVDYRSVGLSDTAGILNFDAALGSASAVQSCGGQHIYVDTLDNAVNDPVTFIKMDLEGWELKALAGAHRHIAQDRPKLALAVYHQAADIRLIHNYVSTFGHGYKVYLRHYTQGWSETVMFFR
jgi:FkbM family methyltransferase